MADAPLNFWMKKYATIYEKRKQLQEQAKELQAELDAMQGEILEKMVEEGVPKMTVTSDEGTEFTVSARNERSAKIIGDKEELMELFHDDPDYRHQLTVNSRSFTSLVKGWLDGDGIPEQYAPFVELSSYSKLALRKG